MNSYERANIYNRRKRCEGRDRVAPEMKENRKRDANVRRIQRLVCLCSRNTEATPVGLRHLAFEYNPHCQLQQGQEKQRYPRKSKMGRKRKRSKRKGVSRCQPGAQAACYIAISTISQYHRCSGRQGDTSFPSQPRRPQHSGLIALLVERNSQSTTPWKLQGEGPRITGLDVCSRTRRAREGPCFKLSDVEGPIAFAPMGQRIVDIGRLKRWR